jgi:hypothetical protein
LALVPGALALGCGKDESDDANGGDGLTLDGGLFGDFGELFPERDEFAFPEACPPTDDLDTCSSCCEAQGYDSAGLFGSDCGCQSTETNDTLCTPAADADTCSSCCSNGGYSFSFFIGDATGGDCSCSRMTTEPHATP